MHFAEIDWSGERLSAESTQVTRFNSSHPGYKWIALSNTTLGVLMATINQTILIIALPVIFKGLQVNPLAGSGQSGLLLWVLLGFNVATTILLVTIGRLSDMYGRVKLYNLGFAIFTIGSILCSITWGKGTDGEIQLIIFRLIQGVGGAFLFANSTAILTDSFPTNQRGFALGLNQIAAIGGGVLGLIVGGLLASTGEWRWVFLVNVPVGLFGTIWAYIALHEVDKKATKSRIDIWGNLTLGIGLLAVLVGLTYGIMPYKNHPMGWANPWIIISLIGGVVMLVLFGFVERFVKDPLFDLRLFKIRAFTFGNIASILSALARGGLNFMLIIWLQGIWLPLHGVAFSDTPLQAGLDTIPQMVGFLIAGPISGYLSDRFGQKLFSTLGLVVAAIGFLLLNILPVDFHFWPFAFYIFIIGIGMGLFSSPNSAAIMNSVPAKMRGAASGMRSTFMNAGMMMSMGIFFSIVISGLAAKLPAEMTKGLSNTGLSPQVVHQIASLPPISSLFAALLGYNPLQSLIPPQAMSQLPKQMQQHLEGHSFFPHLIGGSFQHGLRLAFIMSVIMLLVGALASLLRGKNFVYDDEKESTPQTANHNSNEKVHR